MAEYQRELEDRYRQARRDARSALLGMVIFMGAALTMAVKLIDARHALNQARESCAAPAPEAP